jgi:hypothetical protein
MSAASDIAAGTPATGPLTEMKSAKGAKRSETERRKWLIACGADEITRLPPGFSTPC